MATLEEQIRAQFGQYGDWNAAGVDRAAELADLLRKSGVQSLGELSLVDGTQKHDYKAGYYAEGAGDNAGDVWKDAWTEEVAGKRLKIGDKEVGFLGDYNLDGTYGSKKADILQQGSRLGWSARGDGNVSYEVGTDPATGKLFIRPTLGSSSDKERLMKVAGAFALPLGAAALGIGAAGAVGGAASGGGAAGAAAGAGGSALGGTAATGFELGGLLGAAPSGGAIGAGLGAETAAGLVGGGMLGAPSAFTAGGALATGGAAAGAASGGSGGLMDSIKSGWEWLTGSGGSTVSAGGKLFGNSLLRDLMPLIGAGVSQYSSEKLTEEQRDWIEKQQSDTRRRQKPVKAPGMLFSVKKGKSGG